MQQLLKWTLETIRDEESCFSWMEEHRYEWSPLVRNACKQTVEGKTVLILTDENRKWFAKYITNAINSLANDRPLLPFFELTACFPQISSIQSTQELELLEDMLELSYPNGYYIWYIGRGDHPYTKLSYRSDDSFLWLLDGEVQNSFNLRSSDPKLDIKLLQLYKLFDATLSAVLFGDIDLET
ncbi:MAG: DNA replication regulator family [uncultured Sulfurovum sp.]|uniref:DNA replication regulator family n=1 Tax=uncultured Sulfurovum sp. TaxID=269237 RepID=A0A6S6SB32_9BACT|nr:MAG: DNA replication regulator family [uncultured Sulfurovum sp.]